MVINCLKNDFINSIVVKVSKLADKIGSGIKVPWDPPSIKRDAILKVPMK